MELNYLNNYSNFKSIVELVIKKSHLQKKKILKFHKNIDDSYFVEAEKFAKSARFPSIELTAAHPPFESIPEILNSLNHTSPHNSSPNATEGFFIPIIIFFTPKVEKMVSWSGPIT